MDLLAQARVALWPEPPGELAATEVLLVPEIGVFPDEVEKARRAIAKAENNCFVSNSIRAAVRVEPVFIPVTVEVAH